MKRVILAAAFIAFLGSAGVSWSADFQKGLSAAKCQAGGRVLAVNLDRLSGYPQSRAHLFKITICLEPHIGSRKTDVQAQGRPHGFPRI
jgi:hypothetical protein